MKVILYMAGLMTILFSISVNSHPAITFPKAPTQGKRIIIAAVGDILLHQPLQSKASKQGFQSLWQEAIPYLKKADITYGNLEGPMAYGVNRAGQAVKDPGHRWDNHVYSSFPLFNYHPNLAKALKESGFDIVSTANNHSLDRFSLGIDRTIESLNQVKLKFAGTRVKDSELPWYTLVKRNGFRVAWIACTTNTNGIRDRYNQVLYCYQRRDRQAIKRLITRLKNHVDAIIITPHWGKQYQHYPNANQTRFAKTLLNAGATAIIGNHPHVIGPIKKYITKDGRATLIVYSLGNFVSYQGTPKNRTTIILLLGLTKNRHGTFINSVRYIPAYMQNRSGSKNIRLTLLKSNDRSSIAYHIISKILPEKNRLYPGESFYIH